MKSVLKAESIAWFQLHHKNVLMDIFVALLNNDDVRDKEMRLSFIFICNEFELNIIKV